MEYWSTGFFLEHNFNTPVLYHSNLYIKGLDSSFRSPGWSSYGTESGMTM
jgi:hypothetical protein